MISGRALAQWLADPEAQQRTQARIKAAADAPNLASPLVPTAFNIGIALGASVGAFALDHGWGYVSLPLIGVAVSLAATVIALMSWQVERRATALAEPC